MGLGNRIILVGATIGLSTLVRLINYGSVHAAEGTGASLERVSFTPEISITWLVPPRAEVIVVNDNEQVYASFVDNQAGKVITALHIPDTNATNYATFYSDGIGLSSRVPVNFSQTSDVVLLPPTIYSMPNINDQAGSLGFIGSTFPSASIILEIEPSNNQKQEYKTLANLEGEWQIIPPRLLPGEYQARAKAEFQGTISEWSQMVLIRVLNPADQLIQDLGSSTRRTIDRTIDVLPAPVKEAMNQLDKQSDFASKYLLPTLLTVSTAAQSGLLLQNFLYLIFQALMALGQAVGLIKAKQPMGMVYDSVTKKPLARAIVRLYEASTQRLVETDVTSQAGTFSFLPQEGYYYLRVSKPGYVYPTHLVLGKRDGRYTPVYSGGEIAISRGSAVINVAVPLDPERYQVTSKLYYRRLWQRWFEPLNQWLLWFGFFLALLSYTRLPSRMNFGILWAYVAGLSYFWYQGKRFKREYGLVVSSLGKPLAGVELNLVDTEFNRLVSRRVSDAKGRYQFMVPPGRYKITMVTPAYQLITNSRGAYQGQELRVEGARGQTKRLVPKIVVRYA